MIKGDISKIYNDYKDSDLTTLITYKDVIEDKLKNVIKLSEEIQDVLTDEEFQGDFDKYADIEVSIRADLLSLSTFIEEKRKKNTVKKASSTVEKSNGRVKLPRFEIKNLAVTRLGGCHLLSLLTLLSIQT